MIEQLDLFTSVPPITPSEKWVYEQLRNALVNVIIQNNLSTDKLIFDHREKYSSVWYDSQMAFRICWQGKYHYFSVADSYTAETTPEIEATITTSGRVKGFTNYNFEPTCEGIALFADFLSSVLDQAIDAVTKEFDCCSRFEECSNAKRCINPNPNMAWGCGYRKIMKQGKIYFGLNRNV